MHKNLNFYTSSSTPLIFCFFFLIIAILSVTSKGVLIKRGMAWIGTGTSREKNLRDVFLAALAALLLSAALFSFSHCTDQLFWFLGVSALSSLELTCGLSWLLQSSPHAVTSWTSFPTETHLGLFPLLSQRQRMISQMINHNDYCDSSFLSWTCPIMG